MNDYDRASLLERQLARDDEVKHRLRVVGIDPLTLSYEERQRKILEIAGAQSIDERTEAAALEPFALGVADFIAAKSETPPALIGDESENLLPATGLMILFAKGGKGKTTLTVDATLHLASGINWLGFKIERPLRVLFIENEGPREPFRAKLELKLEAWPHELRGCLFVQTLDWGAFSLAAETHVSRLRTFIEENEIDVVIGDPLDSLGIDGVGSPEDTRKFMALMSRAGLFRDVAFLLLHHPRKEGAQDELDEASGAWGGKPDTMLRLEKLEGDRARLSFPKIRWSRRGTRRALILAFDPEIEGFSVAHEEEDEERDYLVEIETLLLDQPWRTPKEIAAPKKDGGIGANVDTIRKELEAHPDRFESRTGQAAKEVGRAAQATVWKVTRASESVESLLESRESETRTDSVTFPIGKSRVRSLLPRLFQTDLTRPSQSSQSTSWSGSEAHLAVHASRVRVASCGRFHPHTNDRRSFQPEKTHPLWQARSRARAPAETTRRPHRHPTPLFSLRL